VDLNEEAVTIVWDVGGELVYPCTEGRVYLQILDNAPTGKPISDVSSQTAEKTI
jgi:hypothetical protein